MNASPWRLSYRCSPSGRALADRHYNRQSVGADNFVPPGSCLTLVTEDRSAVWVTSWPKANFVLHEWGGAWVNSLFRNEGQPRHLSSDLITWAVAHTRARWPDVPDLGIVTFVDAGKVRRKRDPGRCYLRAGWKHIGFTKGGLWAFQQLPAGMPEPSPVPGSQMALWEAAS